MRNVTRHTSHVASYASKKIAATSTQTVKRVEQGSLGPVREYGKHRIEVLRSAEVKSV
jgi:hypothetical protein